MLVTINNKRVEIKAPSSISDILVHQNYQQLQGIAVAINDMVIPKSQWDDTQIQEEDHILIITATAGG